MPAISSLPSNSTKLSVWRIIWRGAWLGAAIGILAAIVLAFAILAILYLEYPYSPPAPYPYSYTGISDLFGDINNLLKDILGLPFLGTIIALPIIWPFSIGVGILIALFLGRKYATLTLKTGVRTGAIAGIIASILCITLIGPDFWGVSSSHIVGLFLLPETWAVLIIGTSSSTFHGWLTARWLEKNRTLQESE